MSPEEMAAKALRHALESVHELPDTPALRRSTVAAMARASAEPARPRRRQLGIVAAAAALLAAGLAVAVAKTSSLPERVPSSPENAVLFAEGAVEAPPVGAEWGLGTRVRTGATGALRVKVGRGELLLRGLSEVALTDSAHVRVVRGEVMAEFSEGMQPLTLEAGEVVVMAREARFRVDPEGCQGRPSVQVETGEITLSSQGKGEVTVRRNERWPSVADCIGQAPPSDPDPGAERPARPPPPPKRTHRPAEQTAAEPTPNPRPDEVPPAPADPLTHQNALYAQAQAAQHAGKTSDALSLLEQLLGQYPQGPLAETALLQKVRWLSAESPSRAKAAAQAYLNQFPRGPGRAEAEQLVLENP